MIKRINQIKEDKTDRIAKKREELETRANPNQKEIDTCENLITYCNKLKVQQGLVPPTSEEVAKKAESELINE